MNKTTQHAVKAMRITVLASSIVLLASCAATEVALSHKNLDTQTKLSKTIFLDPVAHSQQSVFIVVKNTSDQQSMNVSHALTQAFQAHGYKVTNSPVSAHYMLQANILSVGKMSKSASESALGHGFGSAVAGSVAGSAVTGLSGNSTAMLAGGIVGGIGGLVADSLVKNVNYTMIVDLQISERTGAKGAYQRYKTRVVSTANKVNLSFATAKPSLEAGLVNTIAGIF